MENVQKACAQPGENLVEICGNPVEELWMSVDKHELSTGPLFYSQFHPQVIHIATRRLTWEKTSFPHFPQPLLLLLII